MQLIDIQCFNNGNLFEKSKSSLDCFVENTDIQCIKQKRFGYFNYPVKQNSILRKRKEHFSLFKA